MTARTLIAAGIGLWILSGVLGFRWVRRQAAAEPGPGEVELAPGLRTVTVYARATYGRNDPEEPWHEVTHTYDVIPSKAAMAGVLTWLCRDKGFTIMAAELACDALYDAMIEQEAAGLDSELAALGGAL